jgi:hypothetical protein
VRSLHCSHKIDAYGIGRVRLSACFNSRTAGRILMKFGKDMPLEAHIFTLQFPTLNNTNVTDASTCVVKVIITSSNTGSAIMNVNRSLKNTELY